MHTVFLLGSSSQDDHDLLSFESQYFGDLLQWDIHKSLLNLTHKLNAFFEWTLKNCPRVSFIFSRDDDVFVNSPTLFTYLESMEPPKASQLYVGQVLSGTGIFANANPRSTNQLSFN